MDQGVDEVLTMSAPPVQVDSHTDLQRTVLRLLSLVVLSFGIQLAASKFGHLFPGGAWQRQAFVVASMAFAWAIFSHLVPVSALGYRKPRVPVESVVLVIAGVASMFAVNLLLTKLFWPWLQAGMTAQAHQTTSLNSTTVLGSLRLLMVAIEEEFVFRGYLQGVLMRWLRPGFAITWSAVLFALAHNYSPIFTLVMLPSGFILGFVAYKTGLYESTIVHFIYDGLTGWV